MGLLVNGITRDGRRVSLEKAGKKARPTGYMTEWTDGQVRGFLARMLRADGFTPIRAAKILRSSRATLYRNADHKQPERRSEND